MEIKRDKYLEDLKDRMHNGMIRLLPESEEAESLTLFLRFLKII